MAITKITTPELFDFSATNTALQLPTGDTASRPSAPSAGEWRFNSQLKYVEYYDGAAWFQIDTESSAVTPVANENFNTNTYSGTGATQTIDAKFNEAANFNGGSSYINIPNHPFDYTTMTFSSWVNPSVDNSFMFIFQNSLYHQSLGGSIGWYVRRNSGGALQARGFSSASLSTAEFDVTSASGLIPLNTWTNVVCVLTPTSFNIYINGNSTAVASATFSNAIRYSSGSYNVDVYLGVNYYYFGGSFLYEAYWEGGMDQVRIFNTALPATGTASVATLYAETTTTAATLNYPVGAGCVAAYQLDGNANDISTNNNGTTTDIGYTGLLFQPDFAWIKSRSNATSHELHDSVRGEPSRISSDTLAAASTTYNGFVALTSNGFNLDGAGSGGEVNTLGRTYVSWCWKGGGSATDITSSSTGVSAASSSVNATAGFSIVTYTMSSTIVAVPHGLSSAPKMAIVKRTNTTSDWFIYNTVASGKGRGFFSTAAFDNSGVPTFGATDFTFQDSDPFSTGSVVVYFFADVAGYQKIGTYSGSGGSPHRIYVTDDGLSTGAGGFQPSYVLIKRTNSGGGGSDHWLAFATGVVDSSGYLQMIRLDTQDAAFDGLRVTFNSDGFTLEDSDASRNGSGGQYLYLAIK